MDEKVSKLLSTPIQDLDLSVRALNNLKHFKLSFFHTNLETLEDLCLFTKELLSKNKNRFCGKKTITEIESFLKYTSKVYFGDENVLHIGMTQADIKSAKERNLNKNVIISIDKKEIEIPVIRKPKVNIFVRVEHVLSNEMVGSIPATNEDHAIRIKESLTKFYSSKEDEIKDHGTCVEFLKQWRDEQKFAVLQLKQNSEIQR